MPFERFKVVLLTNSFVHQPLKIQCSILQLEVSSQAGLSLLHQPAFWVCNSYTCSIWRRFVHSPGNARFLQQTCALRDNEIIAIALHWLLTLRQEVVISECLEFEDMLKWHWSDLWKRLISFLSAMGEANLSGHTKEVFVCSVDTCLPFKETSFLVILLTK